MQTESSHAGDAAQIIALSAPDMRTLREQLLLLLDRVQVLAEPASDAHSAGGAARARAMLAELARTAWRAEQCRCRAAFVASALDDLACGLDHLLRSFGPPDGAAHGEQAGRAVPRVVLAGRRGTVVSIYRGEADGNGAHLLAGSAAAAMVRTLSSTGDLDGLALFWVQGGHLDWDALHDGQPPCPLRSETSVPGARGVAHEPRRFDAAAGDAAHVSSHPARTVRPAAAPSVDGRAGVGRRIGPGVASLEIEARLGAIWQSLFGLPTVARHHDFFSLGGDSQLGMRMLAELRALSGIDLPLRDLYEAPTIAQLGERIARLAALHERAGGDAPPEFDEGYIR